MTAYLAQGEASVTYFEVCGTRGSRTEQPAVLFHRERTVYGTYQPGGADIVITFLAPFSQFVSEYIGIQLADEDVFVVLKASIELFGKHKAVIAGNASEIVVVELFCRQNGVFFNTGDKSSDRGLMTTSG